MWNLSVTAKVKQEVKQSDYFTEFKCCMHSNFKAIILLKPTNTDSSKYYNIQQHHIIPKLSLTKSSLKLSKARTSGLVN